jgi:two-component system cell cycle sensor histidine kinase/response regulator CckA
MERVSEVQGMTPTLHKSQFQPERCETVRVLVIEDDHQYGSMIKKILERKEGLSFHVTWVDELSRGLECLAAGGMDVLLLDLTLPDSRGLDTFRKANSEAPEVAIVILTGQDDQALAITALQEGAQDYLVKGQSEKALLDRAVLYAIERKRVQEALRESEEKFRRLYDESKRAEEVYRSLIHSSADAIVIYDLEGRAKYVSPTFTRIFGWALDEVEGKRIPFLPESEKETCMSLIRDLIEKGTSCHSFETKRYTKDGRILDVSLSASRYDDHEGRPAGMLVMLRDISDRRRLEAQLHQAQKMEAVGTLAGGVAHDFNNLLMGIQGRVSLMLRDVDSDHPYNVHLRRIENGVKKGADLTKQLLGFARGGKYEVRPTDLSDLVERSSAMFGRAKKEIRVHRKYDKDTWTVEVDRGQIEQVLVNLYVNACQAMAAGGDLYLETKNVQLTKEDTERYHVAPGNYVKISARDTGVGMDEATRLRVFEPFFTTREMGGGTGLGLASAYGIIKNHGGIINVHSKPGHGATFNIYLRASDKEVERDKDQSRDVSGGTETVLLVDDEDMIMDVGNEMLAALGYHVMVAQNGKQAVELFKENQDKIDMVILDLIMPDMGGGEVFDRLKEINPKVRVLLSSGYSMEGQAQEIMTRGCDGFIQKPFNMEQLSDKLREILENQSRQVSR